MRKYGIELGLFLVTMAAAAALLASAAAGSDDANVPPPPPSSTGLAASNAASGDVAGTEVMMRGPIHEAYAQPVSTGAVSQLVVPKKPPEAIEEIPPDQKPADENTTWIGGYWAWDDGRKDFDWVSGVWRVPPPNERWVAGYWTAVNGGYSWVPGFWAPVTTESAVYYPEPPASLEQGPTSEQPSQNEVWIPGCWSWVDTRYVWRPGYWAAAQPGWVWTAASYCWSPRGWVLCNGYWDYTLDRRGLLFAPVAFTRPIYNRVGYTFSPSVVLDSGLLTSYLFVRPDCSQYYFGDYYAANYDRLGIYPWFAVGSHRGYSYDPLFSFYVWRNASSNPRWLGNLRSSYVYYRAHPEQRLPHTWAAMQQVAASPGNRANRQFLGLASTLQDLSKNPRSPVRLAAVPSQQRTNFQQNAGLMRQFERERATMEKTATNTLGHGGTARLNAATAAKTPQTLRFPQVARTINQRSLGQTGQNLRQTMKPIYPPSSSERRSETIPREARKPVIQNQGTTKGTGPTGVTERKPPPKSMEERKPLETTEKRIPQTIQQRQSQGGGGNKGPSTQQRNVPPPNPPAQRGGSQSPSKGNNKDERKIQ